MTIVTNIHFLSKPKALVKNWVTVNDHQTVDHEITTGFYGYGPFHLSEHVHNRICLKMILCIA